MSPAGQRDGSRYPALASPREIVPRTMRNRIGMDGSRTSLRAAAYASGLARRQHCRLTASM
jgi:hypothetical protein